jgi:ubiquinone/menaquinone biosynthesis C-methylase UbiE
MVSLKEKLIHWYKVIYGFILTVFLDNFDKPDYYEANVLSLTNAPELAREIYKLFRHYYPPYPVSILDIAAGTGIISRELTRGGYRVTACDINENALRYLQRNCPKVEVIKCDMNQPFPFESESFGGVTSVWANRYIRNADAFLSEVHRVLVPRGVFVWPVFKIDVGLWKIHAGLSAPTAFRSLEDRLRTAGFSRIHFIEPEKPAGMSMRTIFVRPYYFICYK